VLPVEAVYRSEDYIHLADVPIFKEHNTVASDGRPLLIDRDVLELIAAKCNSRINESGNLATIRIGHTPADPETMAEDPKPAVGLAGPFRVGTIGAGGNKFAILATLHLRKDRVSELKAYPVISPELQMADDYAEMYMEPICFLGADSPRLDMGLVPLPYSRRHHPDGRRVEIYSACVAAPSVGGPTNSFISTTGGKPKKKYATDPSHELETRAMALQDQEIQQIVDAFLQTPAMAFLTENMPALKKLLGVEAEEHADPGLDPEADPGLDPEAAPGGEPMSEVPPAPPAAPAPEKDSRFAGPVHYSKLYQKLDANDRELRALRAIAQKATATAELERDTRINSERYSALERLHRVRVFDFAKTIERYSKPSVSDAAFEALLGEINDNYRVRPVDEAMLPTEPHELDPKGREIPGVRAERYSKSQLHAQALRYHAEQNRAHKTPTWNECCIEAAKLLDAGTP
jgi:hypothetical protein